MSQGMGISEGYPSSLQFNTGPLQDPLLYSGNWMQSNNDQEYALIKQILLYQDKIQNKQQIIFSKLHELEQRLDGEVPLDTRSYTHLQQENIDKTKDWFQKNLEVTGFESEVGSEKIGTEHPCKIPLVVKNHPKTIIIFLKWLGRGKLKREEITNKIVRQMKIFTRKLGEHNLQYHSEIPPSAISLDGSPKTSRVTLSIKMQLEIPLTQSMKSLISIGVGEKETPGPVILLRDVFVFSRIGEMKVNHANKLSGCLSRIWKKRSDYADACWYQEILEYSYNIKERKAEKRKYEEEENSEETSESTKKPRLEERGGDGGTYNPADNGQFTSDMGVSSSSNNWFAYDPNLAYPETTSNIIRYLLV